jgi:hypothetical protein
MGKVGTGIAVMLGGMTIVSSVILLMWDLRPDAFPARAHDYLAAFALAVIALAWMLWQALQRVSSMEFVKTMLLSAAFLFWAANQLWPNLKQATAFNDIAVTLFVLDVFLVMIGWPPVARTDREFPAELRPEARASSLKG